VRLSGWRASVEHFSKGYLKAYLLLFLLTFSELFLGFSILRVEYALLLALLVSLVDLLPVLGVGIVLVPWSIVMLLQRDYRLGAGLLILYGTVLLVRQIMEPRLVGKSLGLHPLITLFASYAGWRLFGVLGMLLGPVLALAIKAVLLRDSDKRSKL
jgi:sporulation integral membrane protein YtvI